MANTTFDYFKDTLIKAYFFISNADGKIDAKEIAIGHKMVLKEQINQEEFQRKIDSYNCETPECIVQSLKSDLKKLSKDQQIKIIAYMSNIANADGFMDPVEWKMIYNLYKNELNLNLEDIIKAQKLIPPFSN